MRSKICFALLSLFLMLSVAEAGASGFYGSGMVGMTRPGDANLTDSSLPGVPADLEFDRGVIFGAALGYDFGRVRLEGELSYQKSGFDRIRVLNIEPSLSGHGTTLALLVNGYCDFPTDSPLTPFLTAGMGFARLGIHNMNIIGSNLEDANDHDTVFAYQAGAGLSYGLSSTVSAEVKYRYFATSDPEYTTIESEFDSHNLMVGLRFNF